MFDGTLSDSAQNALAILGKTGLFTESYMAGGSALALHLGHRKSFDLDFYTRNALHAPQLAKDLEHSGTFETTLLQPPHTLLGIFNGTKFSIFRYDYPMLDDFSVFRNINIASVKDIAAMKLSAVTGRAAKRDYVDIYMISQQYSLETQLDWFKQKFGNFENLCYSVIKSLQYFDDVDDDVMPQMEKPLDWEIVKTFLANEALKLGHKIIGV